VFYWDFLQFVQHYPATLNCAWFNDEVHFSLGGFVNKQNMRFWPSENSFRAVDMLFHLAKCIICCVLSKHGLGGLIFLEGIITD
jgi:hypothetical protein